MCTLLASCYIKGMNTEISLYEHYISPAWDQLELAEYGRTENQAADYQHKVQESAGPVFEITTILEEYKELGKNVLRNINLNKSWKFALLLLLYETETRSKFW